MEFQDREFAQFVRDGAKLLLNPEHSTDSAKYQAVIKLFHGGFDFETSMALSEHPAMVKKDPHGLKKDPLVLNETSYKRYCSMIDFYLELHKVLKSEPEGMREHFLKAVFNLPLLDSRTATIAPSADTKIMVGPSSSYPALAVVYIGKSRDVNLLEILDGKFTRKYCGDEIVDVYPSLADALTVDGLMLVYGGDVEIAIPRRVDPDAAKDEQHPSI